MPFDAGAVVARLELNTKQWEQSIARVNVDQKSLSGFVLRHGQDFQKFGKTLTVVGGVMVASLGAIVKKTAAAGDMFDELRQKTGISADVLSSFTLAVNKTDLGMTGFATALKFLANNMADAKAGVGTAEAKFNDLGVAFKDVTTGALRPLDQVMLDVADKFRAMPDGAQKSALAVDLFGRAGTSMIHMLNLGREGLQAEMDKAKEYNLVMGKEAAEAADRFQESLVDLKGATQGIGNVITATLLPAIQGIVTNVTEAVAKVGKWAAEHKGLTGVLSGGVLAIGAIATAIGTLSYGIGTVIAQLPKLITGFKAIAAFASKAIVFNFVLGGIALLWASINKFKRQLQDMESKGYTIPVKIKLVVQEFNPFKALSRESMGQVLQGMDAVRDKSINLKGAMYLLGDAFRAIKGAIEQGTTAPILNLGEALKGLGIKTRTELTAELANAEAALKLLKGSVESTPGGIQVLQDQIKGLKEQLYGVKTAIVGVLPPARDLTALWARLTATMVTQAIPAARDLTGVLEAVGAAIPKDLTLPPVDTDDAKISVRSFAQEVSTVVSDAMREIARSIVGAFNIKKLFGAVAIDIEFDSSAFDALVDAADTAYRKISDAASEEYDGIYKTKRREYEDARDLIENSVMDEAAKREALKKFDRDYEDSIDLLKKEEKAKLLAIEEQHKLDLDKIRKDEDAARQKLADDEEKRQGSLWFKVKGIMATAVEEMAALLLTRLFANSGIIEAIDKFVGKLIGKGKGSVTDALDDTGKSVGGLGKTIGEFISGIGTGIGGFISGLAAGIGTAIVSLATAIAQAATILAAAAPAIITVGLIALGLMAGIKLLGSIFGSGGGAGAGDGMGRVVERQDKQLAILQSLIDFCRNNIGPALLIAGVDYMAKTMDAANTAVGWLQTINGTLSGMKGAYNGAGPLTEPQMVMTHGTPSRPEYVVPEPAMRSTVNGAGQPGVSSLSQRPQTQIVQLYLDSSKTKKLAEWTIQTVKNGSQTNRLRGLSERSFSPAY
jgi:TP901 family phage tail tape measure protein